MPLRPQLGATFILNRRYYSSKQRFHPADVLRTPRDRDIVDFDTARPVVLQNRFGSIPAITKWFKPLATCDGFQTINGEYLQPHEELIVPYEVTPSDESNSKNEEKLASNFDRFNAPLSLLLTHISSSRPPQSLPKLYLAQFSLDELPTALQTDLPTPDLIAKVGKGDVYGSSLWMGRPPTNTPLHRDPNPNLLVQLAGRKVVRLMTPEKGRELYMRITGGQGRANVRGEEMMVGEENRRLEKAVWGELADGAEGCEAVLECGDGLYIPLGWWHAVRGVGVGANASVNWWFR